MKFLALLLSLALVPAYAAPPKGAIANMKGWCECVMVGGICQVTNSKPVKPGGVKITSAGPISAEVYEAYRKDPRMCDNGAKTCTEDWDGQACRAGFRLMFRQEPMVCIRPGEPKATGSARPK